MSTYIRNKKQQHSKGFTIFELSIVLIIISILAGGIYTTTSMIENSRMVAAATEKGQLVSAVKLFQDQYYELPGDFSNADDLWGLMSGVVTYSIVDGTLPGDGDGQVDDFDAEEFLVWHHLAIAGYLDFPYVGLVTVDPNNGLNPGTDIPGSQWSESSGWFLRDVGLRSSDATYYDGDYGHVLRLAGQSTNLVFTKVMTPLQLLSLDEKFDDGEADDGKIRSVQNNSCVSGTSYDTSTDEVECTPMWMTGF